MIEFLAGMVIGDMLFGGSDTQVRLRCKTCDEVYYDVSSAMQHLRETGHPA